MYRVSAGWMSLFSVLKDAAVRKRLMMSRAMISGHHRSASNKNVFKKSHHVSNG